MSPITTLQIHSDLYRNAIIFFMIFCERELSWQASYRLKMPIKMEYYFIFPDIIAYWKSYSMHTHTQILTSNSGFLVCSEIVRGGTTQKKTINIEKYWYFRRHFIAQRFNCNLWVVTRTRHSIGIVKNNFNSIWFVDKTETH